MEVNLNSQLEIIFPEEKMLFAMIFWTKRDESFIYGIQKLLEFSSVLRSICILYKNSTSSETLYFKEITKIDGMKKHWEGWRNNLWKMTDNRFRNVSSLIRNKKIPIMASEKNYLLLLVFVTRIPLILYLT